MNAVRTDPEGPFDILAFFAKGPLGSKNPEGRHRNTLLLGMTEVPGRKNDLNTSIFPALHNAMNY